jgi:uncharacterized protein YbjT (DUF2867 family)
MAIDTKSKTILVTGATGNQGGAAARQLLAGGSRVRVLSRDPSKPAARALAELGAELVKGDLDDKASLERAVSGVSGVFSVGNFWEHGFEGEVRHGKAVADASKAAGIEHLVYTSVDSADRASSLPHFESKWQIEQHIRSIGVPATILRPTFFMDNFLTLFRPQALDREGDGGGGLAIRMAMRPDTRLQMIATHDIGVLAAMAFARPDEFIGKTIGLAGDSLTMPEAASAFSRALGRPVQFIELPIDQVMAMSKEMGIMFQWFNDVGYSADISVVRALHPDMLSFEAWIHREKESFDQGHDA